MKRGMAGAVLVNCAAVLAFCQAAGRPAAFEAAGVYVSPKVEFPRLRINPVRNGRYEIRNATMVDLIGAAYGLDADRVIGGRVGSGGIVSTLSPKFRPMRLAWR
jgi:hypothetical protein